MNKLIQQISGTILLVLLLTGCLQTRNEAKTSESRQMMQQQVTTLQKTNADVGSQISEFNERMRELTGRVEEAENKVSASQHSLETAAKANQLANVENSQKIILLQETLAKMETQNLQMAAEIQNLKNDRGASSNASSTKASEKDSFQAGQDLFVRREWKRAILYFQKYRDENSKGKNLAEATYNIGVSFQELGMKDEAKTFYEEVMTNFSKTEFAKKAKSRLKNIK
jgi:TolA-binding protein